MQEVGLLGEAVYHRRLHEKLFLRFSFRGMEKRSVILLDIVPFSAAT